MPLAVKPFSVQVACAVAVDDLCAAAAPPQLRLCGFAGLTGRGEEDGFAAVDDIGGVQYKSTALQKVGAKPHFSHETGPVFLHAAAAGQRKNSVRRQIIARKQLQCFRQL